MYVVKKKGVSASMIVPPEKTYIGLLVKPDHIQFITIGPSLFCTKALLSALLSLPCGVM
jgi:hypothetical protein